MATPTDEAFALLVLENIWDVWMEIPLEEYFAGQRKRKENEKRKCRTGKYTKDYKEATRFGGWNDSGLQRMNDLVEIVKKDRAAHENFEEEYLKEQKGRKEKKSGKSVERGGIIVADDLSGEEDDGVSGVGGNGVDPTQV